MKSLFQTLSDFDKRLKRIEQWLGLPQEELEKTKVIRNPVQKTKKRKHANTTEGKEIRDNIVNLLIARKKLTPKRVIVKAIRKLSSEGALSWYLRDLKNQGKIKMPKRGYYIAH